MAQTVKRLPTMWETWVRSLGREGEGNGNPLQYSCLDNPIDGGGLVGYSPWGCKESDTTERLYSLSLSPDRKGGGQKPDCSPYVLVGDGVDTRVLRSVAAKRGKEAGPRVEGKTRTGKGFCFSFFFCIGLFLGWVEKKKLKGRN